MLTCYVTVPELIQFSAVERHVKNNDVLQNALGTATYKLAEEMRGRGIDPSRVQIPLMFSGEHYAATSYVSGTHTTASIAAGNESRLVADVRNEIESDVTVRLQGSMDETTWRYVDDILGSTATVTLASNSVGTVIIVPRYQYYRAVVECSETVEVALYMVDSAPDECIRWGAIRDALLPNIDENTTIFAVYEQAMKNYDKAFRQLVIDVDTNEDGEISDTELSTSVNVFKAYR